MYSITLTYLKADGLQIDILYTVPANSYEEAISLVEAEGNKRIQNQGGVIISIQ